jgi:hypothetical protein
VPAAWYRPLVKSEVALCEHLSSCDLVALPIESADILDWYDGPVTAITRCPECARLGLLELLDWSRSHRVRVYALAGFDPEPLAVYQRNVAKGSCDPKRFESETAALLASAGPVERLVALDLDDDSVLRTVPFPQHSHVSAAPWPQRILPEEDESWFSPLGLVKTAR